LGRAVIANVVGCFLLGVLLGSRLGHHYPWIKTQLGIGFLGSFTTFSTFSAETIDLIQQGRWSAGGANITISLGAGLLAVAMGIAIGGRFSAPGNAT
jgi:CrcB protein